MADPTMAADPTASADPSAEQGESFTITVTCNSDGTFQVALGEDSTDGAGEGGADASAEQPATANSIEDACKIVQEMYQAESGEESGETDDGADGNAQMAPDDAKAYWNQMASKKKSQGPV